MPKSVVLIESESSLAEKIAADLKSMGYEVLAQAPSLEAAKKYLQDTAVDLVLLNINLAGGSRFFDLAFHLQNSSSPPFVFYTVHPAEKSLMNGYLLKNGYYLSPVHTSKLEVVDEAPLRDFLLKSSSGKQSIKSEGAVLQNAIFVKKKDLLVKLALQDIFWIKADRVHLEIMTQEEKFIARSSLKQLLPRLGRNFIRVHKSYVVNLEHVHAIGKATLRVDGQEIPMGRSFRDKLLQYVSKLS